LGDAVGGHDRASEFFRSRERDDEIGEYAERKDSAENVIEQHGQPHILSHRAMYARKQMNMPTPNATINTSSMSRSPLVPDPTVLRRRSGFRSSGPDAPPEVRQAIAPLPDRMKLPSYANSDFDADQTIRQKSLPAKGLSKNHIDSRLVAAAQQYKFRIWQAGGQNRRLEP
jgi:hypothetical protein